MKKKGQMPLWAKFGIAIAWDILDFTIFRIPGIGTITDIVSVPLAIALWGEVGVLAAWEIADVTDQVDAEIPTMTLIGIISSLKGT
ncbi:MAG: hypothetical protein WC623_22540 [Pedobacter sp.]|uniref:hypothetical protein n=1 Tax=Pedobacter sp. TaxID=1411316 RepID=UPI00356A1C24